MGRNIPRLMVVRVHTDSGLIGLGETVDKIPGAKGALHGTIAPLLLGQDPLDIEGLWRFVMDNIMYHGYAGAETRALSAVEVALWDIMGKHYGAPLYHLLGGKMRNRIPTYNTCIGFGPVQDYAAWHTDAGALAKTRCGRRHPRHENLAVRPLQRKLASASASAAREHRSRRSTRSPDSRRRRAATWKSASSSISAGIAPAWSASRRRSNRITSCLWKT